MVIRTSSSCLKQPQQHQHRQKWRVEAKPRRSVAPKRGPKGGPQRVGPPLPGFGLWGLGFRFECGFWTPRTVTADYGQTDFGQTHFGQFQCFRVLTDFGQTDFGQFQCFSVLAKFSKPQKPKPQRPKNLHSNLNPKPHRPKPQNPGRGGPTRATLLLVWPPPSISGGVGGVVVVVGLDSSGPPCARPPDAGPSPPPAPLHDNPRTPNVHISGPRRFKHHQNSTRRHPLRHKKSEMVAGGEKKKRNFGPPTLRGRPWPHPSGPHPSGTDFFWVWAPPFGAQDPEMDWPNLDWPKLVKSGWPKWDWPKSVSSPLNPLFNPL